MHILDMTRRVILGRGSLLIGEHYRLFFFNFLFLCFSFEEDITSRGDVGSPLMGGIIVRLDWISPQSQVTANLDLKSTKPPKIAITPNDFWFR